MKGIIPDIRMICRCILFCVFVVLPLHPIYADEAAKPPVPAELMYINANVGGASGGHTALKMGDHVFHFQYFPDKIFRVVRDDWPHFRYIYNDLENRTIFSARLLLSPSDYQTILSRLSRMLLIQQSHLDNLSSMRQASVILSALTTKSPELSVKGAGLFCGSGKWDRHAEGLLKRVKAQYGPDYLDQWIRTLEKSLRSKEFAVPDYRNRSISDMHFPDFGPFLSDHYVETCAKLAALQMLQDARAICPDALMELSALKIAIPLSPHEKEMLRRYAQTLLVSSLSLLNSSRPDWGYPLMLQMARWQAVHRSLETGRLMTLDPFSDAATIVVKKAITENQEVSEKLEARARKRFLNIRQEVFAKEKLTEWDYNLLEQNMGRYVEMSRGVRLKQAVRVERGRLIPCRSVKLSVPKSDIGIMALQSKRRMAQRNQKAYLKKLKRLYRYNLTSRNCVTELVRNIQNAFPQKEKAVEALGGWIEPGEAMTFIPFRLFQKIQQRYQIAQIAVIPSYRQRELAKMYQTSAFVPTYLRECNVISSSLYSPLKEDSAFLFFTDDVTWLRPVYGLFNTLWGTLSAGIGVVTLPADGGERFAGGMWGIVFSLPELAFCNIRKGSFNYVEESGGVAPEERAEPAFDRQVMP